MQEKLEVALKALNYKVRYEKGSFKSGYCVIEDQKVVVVNKFYPLESKVLALSEILKELQPDPQALDEATLKLLDKLNAPQPQS